MKEGTAGGWRRRRAALLGLILVLGAGGPTLWAQPSQPQPSRKVPLPVALEQPAVQEALRHLEQSRDRAAGRLAEIGGIVSPSGQEQERAHAVARAMRAVGLQEVRVDSMYNAIGIIPGTSESAVVFVSTLDDLATVAEHQRAASQPPRIEEDRVAGPGANTSSTTVALLVAAQAFLEARLKPERTLVFAAAAQEETGLKGMQALYREYQDRAVAFVDILGDGRTISYGALGIHWWKVYAQGPGGHTLRGGLPNVNQGIGRAVDRILQLPHPEAHADRRTTLNVAIINSGSVFNHKPEQGWFSLDLRSEAPDVIAEMEQDVRAILADVSEETDIGFEMEAEAQIPGGQISGMRTSELVQVSASIAKHLELEPQLRRSGSSNMNVAIAGGTPAIGLGGERGGARGYPEEWASIPAMMRSAKHVLLLAVTMGGLESVD